MQLSELVDIRSNGDQQAPYMKNDIPRGPARSRNTCTGLSFESRAIAVVEALHFHFGKWMGIIIAVKTTVKATRRSEVGPQYCDPGAFFMFLYFWSSASFCFRASPSLSQS